jgi:hypothetical protein
MKTLTNIMRRFGLLPRPLARCSFCRRPYNIAGPFAEGYDSVLICGECAATCGELIDKERERLSPTNASDNRTNAESGTLSAQPGTRKDEETT